MATEPLTARLDQIRHRLDMGNYTDSCCLLAAVEAVCTIACGWTVEAKDVPMIARDLAADVITGILARELVGKGESDG